MCADIEDDDVYDVSAQVQSAQALKHQKMAEISPSPTFDMMKSYIADKTTKFAELREITREQPGMDMLRMLAKTLILDAAWEQDMGDPTIPPKHLCQLRRWLEVDKPPTTTYTIRPVEIAALALTEIAGNSIVPTLPGMPAESSDWYREKGIELLKVLGVDMGTIPGTLRMYWKNAISNRMHFLYSATMSKILGEASPATDARKAPPKSPGSINSSAASRASTLNSMGITHHLSSLHVRSRDINNMIQPPENDAAAADSQADGSNDGGNDGTTRQLGADFDAAAEAGPWTAEGCTDEEWDAWVAQGCPDEHGVTVPVGPAAPMAMQHRPSSVLVDQNIDVSVGMRDADDPRHWADVFYQGMDVKEVLTGNVTRNAAHPALRLIHGPITPSMRRLLETNSGMDMSDANFWNMRFGKAISHAQMSSEAWVKLNVSKVTGQMQNLCCPLHPLNRQQPVRPPNCFAVPDCPCGMAAVLRLATDDYINNAKKDPYPSSLVIGWPYFSCSSLSYATQQGGPTGYRQKCSAGNKSIFVNAVDWLGTKISQAEQAGRSVDLDELFSTPMCIGSLIIQSSSVALTFLHLRTKTNEPVRTDDNPDRSSGRQQNTLDMLRGMATRTAATGQPVPTALAPPPTGTMATSNDHIPRLADPRPQQDGNGTDGNGAGAPALPGTSNEAAALHIGKGKGKG